MKKLLLAFALCASVAATASAAQTVGTYYFDFGSDVSNRGVLTENPDANGHYWNNITANNGNYAASGSVYDNLVKADKSASTAKITLNSRFTTNGYSSGGGFTAPDAALLGDMAVATATGDYFFIEANEDNSNFTISGLNPDHAYRFNIFASRKATDTRTGNYKVEGLTNWSGTLQLAGSGIGANGENQNTSNILVSEAMFPDKDGNIIFTVARSKGSYIALNCMKMEELTGIEKPVVEKVVGLSLSGTAAENGSSVPFMMIRPAGRDTEIFECFTLLKAGEFTLSAITDNDTKVTYGFDGSKVVKGGDARTVEADQLSFIRVDMSTGDISIVPITSMTLVGSVCPGGWSNSAGEEIPYVGNGVWKGTVGLTRVSTVSDRERFVFIMNKSWDYQLRRPKGTDRGVGLNSDGWNSDDININHGTYTVTLDLNDFVYYIESPDGINEHRISVMGSSVANGQGATDNQGYAWMYGQMLRERYTSGASENPFHTSGISVNGNSTVNLLARYNDLIHDFGRYVIFGVSLGNEGIHGAADQEAIYNQFTTNMQTLIARAREDGKIPVVMNNYTRGDFNSSDYEYVRRMNLELDSWDVPVINLLGAIDNGAGKWADSYQNGDDIYHPNTEGHREFFYAMPPSLFDAIKAGKALPVRETGNALHLAPEGKVEFAPEGTVHPFTLVVNFKALPEGGFASITTEGGDAILACSAGTLTYTSPVGAVISYALPSNTAPLADSSEEKTTSVALTHYYAQGRTLLYVDGSLAGEIAEKLAPASVKVSSPTNQLHLSELMFYRSAMNADEIKALNQGRMIRSSMEVYLPFSNAEDATENKAQSLTKVTVEGKLTSGVENVTDGGEVPFKVEGHAGRLSVTASCSTRLTVYTVDGRLVRNLTVAAGTMALPLAPGIYIANGQKVAVR